MRRAWYRRYLPGWIVTGAGSSGGGGGTPTGWPLPFFSVGILTTGTAASFANSANTLNVFAVVLPAQVQFSNISIFVGTTDAVNLYDIGLYSLAGALAAHVGAQTIPSANLQSFAVVGAPKTLNPGLYWFAMTGQATTATWFITGDNAGGYAYGHAFGTGSSSGGVLPNSFTPPAKSVTNQNLPYFALS